MKFENKDTFELHNVFGMGEPNIAYARYFLVISIVFPILTVGGKTPIVENYIDYL